MSNYKTKHEEKILRGLIQNFAYREDLIDHLRSVTEEGTVKLMFPSKGKNAFTTNSLIAKARSISYEALANHIPAFLPEPKPKPEGEKKKTLSEQRAEMFAGFTKMSAKQLKDEKRASQPPPSAPAHIMPQQPQRSVQPSKETISVVLPKGIKPGNKMKVKLANGAMKEFKVPVGAKAGQTIEFTVKAIL